jgi:hypothetical protein
VRAGANHYQLNEKEMSLVTTTKKEALRKASENAEKNSTVQNDEERLTDWEVERIA